MLACVALPVLAAFGLFRVERLLFDAATPALCLLLLFGVLLVLTLAEATRQRRSLEQRGAEPARADARASPASSRRRSGSRPRRCRAPTCCAATRASISRPR